MSPKEMHGTLEIKCPLEEEQNSQLYFSGKFTPHKTIRQNYSFAGSKLQSNSISNINLKVNDIWPFN